MTYHPIFPNAEVVIPDDFNVYNNGWLLKYLTHTDAAGLWAAFAILALLVEEPPTFLL